MKFEDLNDYNGHSSFIVVNELLHVWDDVLSDVKGVKRAASICSGGEVSFFNILPQVEESLDCIDHSFMSMYYALGKYYTIEKLGAEKAHELLKNIRATYDDDYRSRSYGQLKTNGDAKKLMELFAEANGKLPSAKLARSTHYELGSLCPLYQQISLEDIKKFRANRTKITFIHGDLNDLVERGPFDLVYLSNAMEYTGRNGNKFDVCNMVKEGGYIAFTRGRSRQIPVHVQDRVLLKKRTPSDYEGKIRPKYGMSSWSYYLMQNTLDPNYKPLVESLPPRQWQTTSPPVYTGR